MHFDSLLFASSTPLFCSHNLGSSETRARVKPAGDGDPSPQASSVARQISEHTLSHILGELEIASDLTQCSGIDEVDMAAHQFGKGGFGAFFSVTPEQLRIVRHSPFAL